METELTGKVAIVTGAGRMRSIGRPIAKLLAASGAAVVITGTGRPKDQYPEDEKAAGWNDIESVAEEIRAAGGTCVPMISDVSSESAVNELVARTAKELGRVDILVNNAGAARGDDRVPAIDLDYALWKKVLVTNLDGTFLLSKAAAKQMIAQGEGGSIVNISSIASKLAGANSAAYASSKAGINALSHAMAMELAQYKIRVNSVCPGIIDTFRLDDVGRGEAWERMVKSRIPLGYPGDGTEIAEMTLFLCTRRGEWITGQAVNVDGGTTWG